MRTVLVVDEDESFRRLVTTLAASQGDNVVQATRRAEALEILDEQVVEVVVAATRLPDGSGFDLAGKIGPTGRRPAVILASDTPLTPEQQSHARRSGVFRMVHKPRLSATEFIVHLAGAAKKVEEQAEAEAEASTEGLPGGNNFEKLRAGYVSKMGPVLDELQRQVLTARGGADEGARESGLRAAHALANKVHGSAGSYGLMRLSAATGYMAVALQDLIEGRLDATADIWSQLDEALELARKGTVQPRTLMPEDSAVEFGTTTRNQLAVARVLVVGRDEATVATLKRSKLVEIVHAPDESAALEAARRGRLDCAFIIMNPHDHESGLQVARHLRALADEQQLPLAFVTDRPTLSDRIEAAHAGASLLLTQPITEEAFASAVRQLSAHRSDEIPSVMVVDDDIDFADLMREMLEEERIQVSHVTNPAEVLEALEAVRPDLLLLDVHMPGLSGFDVCRMLRATPQWQDLPVLLVTSEATSALRIAAFEAGADDYITTPIVKPELLARIRVRIDRSRLAKDRADRDALTGLLLRRAFTEALDSRLAEAKRQRRLVSFVLIDLDHFKHVNDTYGHLAGDRVLSAFGRLLSTRFRAEDLRARWGGEEFALALVGEDASTVRRILARSSAEFTQQVFRGDHGERFSVTFSAGIAMFPDDGQTIERLCKMADERLYEAKEAGRNRINVGPRPTRETQPIRKLTEIEIAAWRAQQKTRPDVIPPHGGDD